MFLIVNGSLAGQIWSELVKQLGYLELVCFFQEVETELVFKCYQGIVPLNYLQSIQCKQKDSGDDNPIDLSWFINPRGL